MVAVCTSQLTVRIRALLFENTRNIRAAKRLNVPHQADYRAIQPILVIALLLPGLGCV